MTKHARAYAVIRERILDGTYGPGYRLVIDGLARELGISPLPVREAIRRLEAEGWVVYRPNAGAQVAPLDPAQWEEAMAVLALLEGHATALAAPGLRASDLNRLRRQNAAMKQALEAVDVLAFSRLNREFHFAIYARCPNAYLRELLRTTWDRLDSLRRTVFHVIPERGWASLEEHARLIALFEQGAPAGEVERVAREHKLRTVEAYRKSLGQASRRDSRAGTAVPEARARGRSVAR